MNTVVKIQPKDVNSISFQEASFDIWDKKYRLTAKDGSPIDKSMDDTYKRVARALAGVEGEAVREHWYERFLWALRRGAIPAGRVTSNAGTPASRARGSSPCPGSPATALATCVSVHRIVASIGWLSPGFGRSVHLVRKAHLCAFSPVEGSSF